MGCILVTFGTQMLHRFGRLQIRGVCAGSVYHGYAVFPGSPTIGQGRSIFSLKGWPSWYAIIMGGLQRLQQRLFANIGIRIVYKNAGIHIAVSVDVQIAPAAGDTAIHKLGIILEIHGEQRFLGAVLRMRR